VGRVKLSMVWLLVPWVGIAIAGRRSIRDNSFLWHVEAGRLQRAAGEVLTTDPFSAFFAGQPWRTQSWLLELGYAALESLGPLQWVPAFLMVGSLGLFLVTGVTTYLVTRSAMVTAVSQVGLIWLALPYLSPRPVLASYMLLAITVLLIRIPRLWWMAPLVIWVWAATHGSFVLGIGILVLEALRRKAWSPARVAVVSLAAASLTAHGWRVWEILWGFLNARESLGLIAEWAPTDLTSPARLPYAALIVLVLFGSTRGSIESRDLWVVAPFLLFGLTSVRAVLPAAIVVLPFAARAVPQWRSFGGAAGVVPALAVLILLVGPFLVPVAGSGRLDPVRFPVDAADHLDGYVTFHDDVIGGYLIYAGETGVMVDDRAELYPGDFLSDVVMARRGEPGWKELFAERGITQILARADDGIAVAVRDEGWAVIFEDDEFVVLRRPARG